jgi:hypothetical protein
MLFIYISGRYTGDTHDYRSYFQIARHILAATEAAAKLARLGYGFFNPHQHSAHFEVITPEVRPDYWYALDFHFLQHCDGLLLLPGWKESKGARMERDLAESMGIPHFHSIEELVEKMPATPCTQGED